MAKGDVNSGAAAQQPKMDQYSVMHRIMDNLGGQVGGMMSAAPSQNFNMPGIQPPPTMGGQFKTNDPSMGNPPPFVSPGAFGQYAHDFTPQGSVGIIPNNPQEMIRRTMTGNNGMNMS